MKLFTAVAAALSLLASAGSVLGANSFAGNNLYYAAGLSADDQATLFNGMQSANMKVLRVWIGKQTASSGKGPITPFNDLEPTAVGTYDDNVLNLIDTLMVNAHDHGVKLLITMHSWNALEAKDIYGSWYGTGDFYEQAEPQAGFDNRLKHILNHVHSTLGKPWSQLSDYIFGFEAENEAMIGNGASYVQSNSGWQCARAKTIKSVLGDNSGILVMTGGESWMDESVQDAFLQCASLDVISIHGYGTGDFSTSSIQTYVTRAQNAGKKLLYEEWGACYYTTENNNCPNGAVLDTTTRNNNIKAWASQITAAGVPWLYWQVLPTADPHYGTDFEIGMGDASWSTIQTAAQDANKASAVFDYSAYLL